MPARDLEALPALAFGSPDDHGGQTLEIEANQ
jgi:hypothetical protein